MPNIRWLLALITSVHRWIYLKSGGRIGHKLLDKPMLLLETVGRKSGQPRITPLLYAEDGEAFVVVASNMGDARFPAWWHNLQARPEAVARVGPRRVPVRWRRADAAEEARLWPRLESFYPAYIEYRARAGREIPIVILDPPA
ncbi:MAG: nitroreductase family deazaflavin-dependent oxidoreductase [Myxococcota bacterium]